MQGLEILVESNMNDVWRYVFFFFYIWSKIVTCFVKEKKTVWKKESLIISVFVYQFMVRVTYRFLSLESISFYNASTIL